MRKLKLPFTTDLKGGSKKSFKILSENEINKNIVKKKLSVFNIVKKFFINNNIIKNSIEMHKDKMNYIKGSSTENYYKNLSSKKK